MRFRTRCRLQFLGLAVLLACSGCGQSGPEPPKTYPVEGHVRLRDGSPLKGGGIEFRSTVDPSKSTFGEIKDDGTYSLYTLLGNTKLNGAMEGPHKVTITPAMGKDQTAMVPTEFPELYTVKPEEKNRFDFTVIRTTVAP